jgi:hypothetical protein
MHQFPKRTVFSLLLLCVLALTASSQTPPTGYAATGANPEVKSQQQGPRSPEITPPVAKTRLVAGKTSLYCAGYIRYDRFPKTPEIVGAQEEQEQNTFSEGDVVYLNAGAQQGIKVDQNFQIIRPRGDVKGVYREKKGFLGTYVQEVGQLQVFKVLDRTSIAQITYSCDSALLGDLLVGIPYRESPVERDASLDLFSDPTGKQTGRLMMARDGREMVTKNDVVYIDLGSEDKVKPGDYLTIYQPFGSGSLTHVDNEENARGRATGFQSDRYRGGGISLMGQRAKDSTAFVNAEGRYRYRPITSKAIKSHRPPMPRKILGEMVIIDVQARTATAIITRAALEVHTGDWVELQ